MANPHSVLSVGTVSKKEGVKSGTAMRFGGGSSDAESSSTDADASIHQPLHLQALKDSSDDFFLMKNVKSFTGSNVLSKSVLSKSVASKSVLSHSIKGETDSFHIECFTTENTASNIPSVNKANGAVSKMSHKNETTPLSVSESSLSSQSSKGETLIKEEPIPAEINRGKNDHAKTISLSPCNNTIQSIPNAAKETSLKENILENQRVGKYIGETSGSGIVDCTNEELEDQLLESREKNNGTKLNNVQQKIRRSVHPAIICSNKNSVYEKPKVKKETQINEMGQGSSQSNQSLKKIITLSDKYDKKSLSNKPQILPKNDIISALDITLAEEETNKKTAMNEAESKNRPCVLQQSLFLDEKSTSESSNVTKKIGCCSKASIKQKTPPLRVESSMLLPAASLHMIAQMNIVPKNVKVSKQLGKERKQTVSFGLNALIDKASVDIKVEEPVFKNVKRKSVLHNNALKYSGYVSFKDSQEQLTNPSKMNQNKKPCVTKNGQFNLLNESKHDIPVIAGTAADRSVFNTSTIPKTLSSALPDLVGSKYHISNGMNSKSSKLAYGTFILGTAAAQLKSATEKRTVPKPVLSSNELKCDALLDTTTSSFSSVTQPFHSTSNVVLSHPFSQSQQLLDNIDPLQSSSAQAAAISSRFPTGSHTSHILRESLDDGLMKIEISNTVSHRPKTPDRINPSSQSKGMEMLADIISHAIPMSTSISQNKCLNSSSNNQSQNINKINMKSNCPRSYQTKVDEQGQEIRDENNLGPSQSTHHMVPVGQSLSLFSEITSETVTDSHSTVNSAKLMYQQKLRACPQAKIPKSENRHGIGKIRRFSVEKGGYGDWEDIEFESFNCKHPRRWRELNIDDSIEIPLHRGGLIRVFPNFLTDLRRSVVTDAMERCTLYRQYYTGPGNSCPESHIHVLLSSNSSCKLQEEDASLPLEKCYPGYAYHGVSMKANPLSQVPEVDRLAYDLAGLYRLPENEWNIGADLVVFRYGMDSIAWQGEVLILCIVVESQHEPRPILIRPKIKQSELQEGDEEIIIFIDQGDAYEMDGQMQASYEHCLPINRNDLEAKRSVVILRHGVAGLVSTDSGVAVHDCSHKKNVSINVVDNKNPVSKQITSIKSGFPRSGIEEGADIVSMKYLIDTGAHYSDHQLEVSGNIQDGCESILLCKLNFELREVDELCWFQYTTERDQGGGALCRSYHEKLPIRVFRSSQLSSQYAPSSLENGNIGYRYDGLYAVKAIYDKNGDETEVYPPAGVKHTFFLTRLPKKSINGFIEPSIYYNSSGLQELWNKIQEKNCIKPEKFEITQPFKKLGPIPEVKESNSVANISVMKRKENAVAQMNKQPRIQENLGKQSNVKKVVPIEEVSKSCIEKDESGSDNIHSNELCKNISIGIIKSSVSELKRNNASERIKQSKPGDKCGSSDCNNIIAIPAPISCMIDRKETNSQSETKKSVACNIKLEIDNNITSGDDCIKNEEHDKQEKGSGKDKAIKLSKNVKNKTTDDENDTDKNFTSIEKSSKRSLVHISTTRKLEKNEFVEQKINEKKKRKLKSKYPLNPSKTSNDDDDGGCGGMWKKSHLNKIKPSSIHMGCRVSVEYKDILYKATVRKSRAKNNSYDFLIHYDGNKKSNVRWIPMSMIHDIYLGDNTENPKIIKANTLKYEISLDEKLLRSQQSLVNHDCKNNGIKKTKTSNNIMEEKSSVAIETQTKAEHIDNNVKTKKLQCHSVDESLQNTYDQSFPLGADVYVEYRSILYSAIVRNCRLKGSKVEYLVHYDGYKKTSDKWVEESTLSEINCRTTRRFKKLRKNPTEKNRPPALKKKEEGDADEKMKDSTLSLRKTRSKIGEGIHDRVSNTSVLDMEGFNSGVEFLPGSCIFVNWKNSLHLSKMLKRRKRGKISEYFVHYDGYSTDDEAWVPLSVVYEVNPQTKRIFEKTSDTRKLTHQFTPSSRTRGAASRQVGTSTSISSETNSKCKNRKMSFAQTVDSFRIYSGVEFLPGSMIFAERKNKLHLAKMIKRRGRGDNMEYYIHYDGSKEHTDTWKSILLVYEINPQTKRMFNQQKK